MTTTQGTPLPTIRSLVPHGWPILHEAWAWTSQCPECGRDITEPALSFLVNHITDHISRCHPAG